MRRDIQLNERAFSSKEVAEEVGIATPTVRKYGQILERNGYEFLKDGDRRIFVQSDIGALIVLRDTDKPLDDTAKELVYQQKERLEGSNETQIAIPDTYEKNLFASYIVQRSETIESAGQSLFWRNSSKEFLSKSS
ncbi:hypothetical protein [Peribacillus simplex]|uniref:hypothetical protein n=1 Tax=Peribacillus simplex TaxID=1478 RepID=UPI00296ECD16|nr:hypothetical protein [Peribacillus simplex]